MGRRVEVVVLCEGVEDWDFARQALSVLGWKKRKFSPKYTPRGDGGSAEQFVRMNYPNEVREIRKRERAVLLVVTDADKKTVQSREATLAMVLRNDGQRPRARGDAIAHWIPRRNLETWVYLYSHGPVNEVTDYAEKVGAKDYQTAAKMFGDDLARKDISPRRCSSLAKAIQESERVR